MRSDNQRSYRHIICHLHALVGVCTEADLSVEAPSYSFYLSPLLCGRPPPLVVPCEDNAVIEACKDDHQYRKEDR
jgi:hypothetical protein